VSLVCPQFRIFLAAYNDDGSHIVGGTPSMTNQYWNTTHGNYIDIAVIEWCKLFGSDRQEKFHWKSVVNDAARYKKQLLTVFGKGETEWAVYRETILKYRDKFVAHLDEEKNCIVPYLKTALKLVENHYDYLLEYEAEDDFVSLVPPIQGYYQKHFEMARKVHVKCTE
jgi:hypothetical protein